ncbi:MAG: OmpA family protein [Chitinophagaceae bacterium]|nr:OmpA family protein [Chitinophagaceae bacterium]
MKRKFVSAIAILCMLLNLTACYMYDGPIRGPYQAPTRNLPPPPEKIVGTPLNKKEYLEKTYQEIKSNLTEAEVVMIEDSIKVLFPNNILYQNKGIFPDPGYEEPLIKFSTLLKKYRKTEILITGHSDNRGDATMNRKLSTDRAKYVLNFIEVQGVTSNRLKAWGLGSNSPIGDNNTEEGRKLNRRVEFVVLYQD